MTTEAVPQSQVILRASQMGFALWRNNSGAVTTDDGRHIRFGLGNESAKFNKVWKSPDLVGIGPNGRFLAVEMKRPGWVYRGTAHEVAQANALNMFNDLGGIGFFCTSVEEFENEIRRVI